MIEENGGDVVLNSIVGRAGLEPTLTALRTGRRLALANKESLVVAGDIVMETARAAGQEIYPVD
ncbi:MAG: 1-deoxy-D-xylulose-5-phosphate reductoisomerase, partial [Clostridia bacterium]|nr:1-deoxy-D-xylulose-5-phosphate reductoisomerase [Clostridia bacterium]